MDFLFPQPKKLRTTKNSYDYSKAQWIKTDASFSANLKRHFVCFTEEISSFFPKALKTIAGIPQKGDALLSAKLVSQGIKKQGYILKAAEKEISLEAADEAGMFYGLQTLKQILKEYGAFIPGFTISDEPDFPNRGVMLDVSRCKVPKMETLYGLIDWFASMKMNQVQLYMEHTFAFSAHEKIWYDASPFSAEEIIMLDAYCAERFVELVPNFNSFGHFERWLRHDEYKHLAECPDGFENPWGGRSGYGTTLKPDKESLKLLDLLYAEFLPNFSSKQFNVGCDETWELGKGWSKKLCEKKGNTRVYLDFLLKIDELTRKHGRRMMFWGDIILHNPELIKELPKDIVALNWGYEATHPYNKQAKSFAEAGVPFYVCPGTSSWNSLTGRTNNCLQNLKNASKNGSKFGAEGYLNTDWGDGGHHQYQPLSYIGYAGGAAASWNGKSNLECDVPAYLNREVFKDKTGETGNILYEMGNTYELLEHKIENNTIFNRLLFSNEVEKKLENVSKRELKASLNRLEELSSRISKAAPTANDAALLKAELMNNIKMAMLGIKKGIAFLEKDGNLSSLRDELDRVVSQHEDLWLSRNRRGGLRESSDRLRNVLAEKTES